MLMARILVMLLATAAGAAFASGPELCKMFVSADKKFFLLDASYKASDVVAIGQVSYEKKPILKIKNKIKGNESDSKIQLTSSQCQGTACSGGFSVAEKVDLLFFLKRQANGTYDSVTGNGNYSCPVVYEVKKEMVNLGDKEISVKDLKKYLQSNPAPVPLY